MEQKIVHEFSRLRVLSNKPVPTSDPPSPKQKKKLVSAASAAAKKMDALVHDLNTALELDEANNSSANAGSGSGAPGGNRRRVWRRRCKSTSNLSCLNTSSATATDKKTLTQNSEDSSSSTEDDTRAVILTNDRGTSSLQLSDSEEEKVASTNRHSLVGGGHHSSRRVAKNNLVLNEQQSTSSNANSSVNSKKLINFDTDSVNENFSPVRPSTKRKRKFKRMALDPDNSAMDTSTSKGKTGTIKRKKVRSKSACDSSATSSKSLSVTLKNSNLASTSGGGSRQRQVSTANVVPGKRKRSSREKSVEPDLVVHSQSSVPSHSMITEEPSSISADAMDCDDGRSSRRSSSSLSSSDWEEAEGADESSGIPSGSGLREDDGEADDEQSDWPGHESVYGGFTDDEQDLDSMPLSALPTIYATPSTSEIENFQALTSTARQAYLARMKRLADCVPGREIRAGSRRLRNPQSGFTIKSSSSEQLSRFLQDPQRTELRLTVLRATDRSKIAQMATLYSLQLRYEGPNILILAKTGKTVKVDYFIVPKVPAKAHPPMDVKRRRRTPPPSPGLLEGPSTSSASSVVVVKGSGALTDSPIDEKSPSELTRRQSN